MKHLILIVSLFFPIFLLSQEYKPEIKDDDYLPMDEDNKKFTPAYTYQISNIITTVQVNISEDGMNISNDAANEPSLAINLLNENEMLIAWRQFDNIESNFRQAGHAYTSDGGITWTNLEPIEAGVFRSDPVLATNSNGKFFYNSLYSNSSIGEFYCDVFSSYDPADLSEKTYAHGGDKQWMVIDKTQTNSDGNIYANWKQQFSVCEGDFTVSYDDGATYDECSMIGAGPTRGTLEVDPDGIVYNAGGYGGSHRVLRSESARDPATSTNWEFATEVDLKGGQALYDGPNPAGMLGQVWVATDHSQLDSRGNVYLLSSVDRSDNSDPCDIMFSRSTDRGETWSEAIKINDDNSTTNWQWFGTMSVAPNGRIDAVWLDTRDFPNSVVSSLYYSNSFDGGETWSKNEKLSEDFHPHFGWPNQQKMGDYFHMISNNDFAFLAWAGTFNGEQDVFFSKIDAYEINTSLSVIDEAQSISIYPNPFDETLTLEFQNEVKIISKVSILDVSGRALSHKNLEGLHSNIVDLSQVVDDLNEGVYFVKIYFEKQAPEYSRIVKN